MVKALARAFRWRKLLEAGAYGSIEELAEAEKINPSYVSCILRLTLLAPDIVELVLNGIHDPKLILATLMHRFLVIGLASDYSGHCPNSQSEGACSRSHYAPGSIATSTTRPVVLRPAQGLCSSPP
jgi:hypothetical protein